MRGAVGIRVGLRVCILGSLEGEGRKCCYAVGDE
jgi:hypothetical protein